MGADASWTIVAPTPRTGVTLEVDMHAFHVSRPLAVRLDAGAEQTLDVDADPRTYRIGPLALTAGIAPAHVSLGRAGDDRRTR